MNLYLNAWRCVVKRRVPRGLITEFRPQRLTHPEVGESRKTRGIAIHNPVGVISDMIRAVVLLEKYSKIVSYG